jgi:hypothetical protein
MTHEARRRLLAAFLHAAYLQGNNGASGPLVQEEVEKLWSRLRKRSVKAAWLADAGAILAAIDTRGSTNDAR